MSGIVLEKGRLSAGLRQAAHDRYDGLSGVGPGYADARWRGWKERTGTKVYVARKDGKETAWIVYDPAHSMIEEILADGKGEGAVLDSAIDALIARESLVAAEVPEADREKYRRLVEYGFRPVRSYVRHGLSLVRLELSTAVYFKRRKEPGPAKPYRRKERVAIERVGATRTDDEIRQALRRLVGRLGGFGRFVKPGAKVVIKPNVISDHGLRDGIYKGGIVTDIRVVRSLIELLLPIATEVIVAEGSSINRSETGRMFAHYGYDRLVDLDSRVRLVDLNKDDLVEKRVPAGKRMSSRKVPRTMEEADVIINLPVLKIHFAAGFSMAMKNLQGAMPPLEKYMSHFFGLWQSLVNIHHLIKPRLTIVDGLTGQEDFGPVSGTPKDMNLLIGGTNEVAVDAVASRVMGLDPAASPPVLLAYQQGLGPIEPELIEVVGASIDEVASPFRQPEIDIGGGEAMGVHEGDACSGCRAYLHFALSKLRKPDPRERSRLLIDRPLEPKANIFLGPATRSPINAGETNIFMGVCQQHHAAQGTHLPGCPPHAEVIINAISRLFPDIQAAKYADETEDAKLERMLNEILAMEGRGSP